MVVAQVDAGYADVDTSVINQHILNSLTSRSSVTTFEHSSSSIRETFKTIQPSTLSGDSDFAWDFIATNASGGVLVKGRSISKFDVQGFSLPKSKEIDFASKLDSIKHIFALTNEQLADVIGSSRKTVHNWSTSTNRPNRSKAKRILELDSLAKLWISRGFTSDRDVLFVKGQSGSSLLELLSSENLDKDLIMFHGASMYLDSIGDDELEDPFA
ncbi:hypothetical protein [Vibrio furnissii]|uniref:hypothetical protein n=1 Tax=Vibrio furnissii TaxID=29494 RepID=UPI001EEA035F|nr:hypothetical protein [Vibrio furnissii]MCG6267996.1 hypothetical protein [Vibrio furnissii]